MAKFKVPPRYTSVPPSDEHEFQVYCHLWLHKNYDLGKLGYAVPNGAKLPARQVPVKDGSGRPIYDASGKPKTKRVSKEADKLIKEGLTPGVADYFIAKPIQTTQTKSGWYHGCYIELKFGSNTQSPDQILFQKQVEAQDYLYLLIYDNRKVLDSNNRLDTLLYFKQAVSNYLGHS